MTPSEIIFHRRVRVLEHAAKTSVCRTAKGGKQRKIGVCYVEETAPDNASSTELEHLVLYVEDARFRAGDKCRWRARSNSPSIVGGEER